MPQTESAIVDVRLPSGRIAHIPRENLVKAKTLGAVEIEEKAEDKGTPYGRFTHELARGMGFNPQKIQHLGGKSQLKQMLEASKEFMVGTGKWMEATAKDPFHIIDPIESVATGLETGTKELVEALKSKDPEKIRTASAHAVGALTNLAAGADRAGALRDVAGLPKTAVETLGKGAKTGSRELLGVGEKSVERARTAAEEAATEKMKEYTEKKAKYDAKVAEAKAEHEAKMAEKQAKHEADVLEAKAAHEAKLGAAEQSLAGRITREAHGRLKESRLNKATQALTGFRDKLVSAVTKNLEATETAERQSLDMRYEDFRRKVLGVTPETPNGTLQANLSPIGEAVLNARKNILKGSRTNITIFNDIMGRMKDLVEGSEGELKPLEGQTIPTDQLRGYHKELGDKIFEGELPGDVRRALDHVREVAQDEIKNSIRDVHGTGALSVYDKLSEDWSAYKRVWYDRTSGSPLPRVLKTMRVPVALHEGVNMEGQIADLLSRKHAGQSITTLLARKSQFGAKPELVARMMAVNKKLTQLPDLYETIPVAKYPRFPGEFKPEEAPKPEPFKSTREEPEKPDIEKFSPEKFRRETIGKEADYMSRLQFWDVAAVIGAVEEFIRGNPHSALAAAAYPVLKRLLARGIQSKPAMDWLAK